MAAVPGPLWRKYDTLTVMGVCQEVASDQVSGDMQVQGPSTGQRSTEDDSEGAASPIHIGSASPQPCHRTVYIICPVRAKSIAR